jgi:hypothetical protein
MTIYTPRQLLAKVRKLPVSTRFADTIQPPASYASHKDHWIGWLSEYDGPGYYGRIYEGRTAANVNPATDEAYHTANVAGIRIASEAEVDALGNLLTDVAAIEVSPLSPDIVSEKRTWIGDEYRARNIVEVGDNFAGTFACKPDLNTATTINTVSSVTITGAATVTATDLSIDRSRTQAHFTVPALTTTGTYTVVVTVTTVDGQTIPTTCTLKVN